MDENHLERIEKNIESVIRACQHSKHFTKITIVLNNSIIEHLGLNGVGEKTKRLVKEMASKTSLDITILSKDYNNSMAKGYNYLLKYFHKKTNVNKICVFADDYIVPKDWVDIILDEFINHADADFIIPSTSFVAQKNLLIPFDIPNHWQTNEVYNGNVIGISSGVKIKDIDSISSQVRHEKTIRYFGPPSFETTVFKRSFIDRFGYLCDKYYSLFFNREFFEKAVKNGAKGYISRRSFVFHYGKGGTKAVHKGTGDEKFKGSPVERNLINDVDLYNKRNDKEIDYWWRNSAEGQSPVVKMPNNFKVRLIIFKYNLMNLLKRFPIIYKFIYKSYKKIRNLIRTVII